MYLAKVLGNVVASVKAEGLQAQKLMLVQPLDGQQNPTGTPHVAVDTVRAGEGDLVSCVGSREAALACDPTFVPVDAAIIGIVDAADIVAGPPVAKARSASKTSVAASDEASAKEST